MRRLPEQTLWDAMLNAKPPRVWLERFENAASFGVPDVLIKTHRWMSWCELKNVKRPPKRESTRLLGDEGLNPNQINWHLQAASLELPCYTLIRASDTRELLLIHAAFADGINDMTRAQLRDVSLADSWVTVFSVLARGIH